MATGASSRTRRGLTAATACALAFIGAVVGTAAAYIALIGFSRTSNLDGLSSLAFRTRAEPHADSPGHAGSRGHRRMACRVARTVRRLASSPSRSRRKLDRTADRTT